jgi:hypothetical protein
MGLRIIAYPAFRDAATAIKRKNFFLTSIDRPLKSRYQYFQGIFRKSPSWHRVLPLVAIKAPYHRLGTVRRLNGAGLLLYFSYGRWHSVLAKRGSVLSKANR